MNSVPDPTASAPLLGLLDAVAAEIEAHLAGAGWDQKPALFALVPTRVVAADPGGAELLGLGPDEAIAADSLTPVAQDDIPEGPLDEALAGLEWPETVAGCALAQEILILPPDAEAELSAPDALGEATRHPQRREARLVVAVLRNGQSSSVLRLRGRRTDGNAAGAEPDDIAFGADLAPNLSEALQATLHSGAPPH